MKGKRRGRQKNRQLNNINKRLDRNGLLPAQLGQLKTGQSGKGLLLRHLWCPNDLARLHVWDRIENNRENINNIPRPENRAVN